LNSISHFERWEFFSELRGYRERILSTSSLHSPYTQEEVMRTKNRTALYSCLVAVMVALYCLIAFSGQA
jgi:hypothetical protein